MAPTNKGNKRAAEVIEVAPAKRLNDLMKQRGVSKKHYTIILESLNHPMAGLSEECRRMLEAIIPDSLLVAVEERHATQATAVKMIEEVLAGIKVQLESKANSSAAVVDNAEASKAAFESTVSEAKSVMDVKVCRAGALKEELAAAAQKALSAKNTCSSKVQASAMADAEFQLLQAEREQFAKLLSEDFAKLRDGSYQDPNEAQSYFNNLDSAVRRLSSTDESFLTALPSILKPPAERGSFDMMVVAQIGEVLMRKESEVAAATAAEVPKAELRKAEIQAAEKVLEAAKEVQQRAALALIAAQREQKDSEASYEAAREGLGKFRVQYKQFLDDRDEAAAELDIFTRSNISAFEKLRNRSTKLSEVNEAPAELSAESVAEAAVLGA